MKAFRNARPTRRLVAAACALAAGLAAIGTASASNIAIKFNAPIYVLGPGALGRNLLTLPYRNPYQGSGGPERLCQALGLSNQAQIIQWDGLGLIFTHQCGTAPQFQLLDRKGVMVLEPGGTRNGIIVGSHVPGDMVTLQRLGIAPVGINVFPNLHHGTAVTPEDLCTQCGLSASATVIEIDANAGINKAHTCGTVPQFNLTLGLGQLVFEPNGPLTCLQPHF